MRESDPLGVDSDRHLRALFPDHPARIGDEVLPALPAAVSAAPGDGRVGRLHLDTDERKVKRHGGAAGIQRVGRLLHADGEAVLAPFQQNAHA